MNAITLPKDTYNRETFESNGKIWYTQNLIKQSEELPEFDLQLNSIDVGVAPWEVKTVHDFMRHLRRIENADLQYPVLMMPDGYVCNGWHRIVKAWREGETTIKAKRFVELPDYDLQTSGKTQE